MRERAGPELIERLEHLDARIGAPQQPPPRAPRPVGPEDTLDFDVVVVGGGLSLLYAPLIAALGARVAVFDRARIGEAHREWNASGPELDALVRSGLMTRDELDRMIIARYAQGICRWHGGGSYPVTGVLDHAVDAGALLAHARRVAIERGAQLYDGVSIDAMTGGRHGVRLQLPGSTLTAKLVIDARGSMATSSNVDLVCPTVGGVMRGLDVDRESGDILVTTEDVEAGRQHIWEGFPGRANETTVYLFYYAPRASLRSGGLMALYARFFERLTSYAPGEAELVRPTFGVIPGWSRLTPAPKPPQERIALVGDAAARHSPLTYCGFGATLRSLERVPRAIAAALGSRMPTNLDCIVDDAPIHAGTGLLAWMMAEPHRSPRHSHQINALLDAAFCTLHAAGNDVYGSLLKDEMTVPQLIGFLRDTAARRPRVYRDVLATVGAHKAGRWSIGLAKELLRV